MNGYAAILQRVGQIADADSNYPRAGPKHRASAIPGTMLNGKDPLLGHSSWKACGVSWVIIPLRLGRTDRCPPLPAKVPANTRP
jgi:hypothetical protein